MTKLPYNSIIIGNERYAELDKIIETNKRATLYFFGNKDYNESCQVIGNYDTAIEQLAKITETIYDRYDSMDVIGPELKKFTAIILIIDDLSVLYVKNKKRKMDQCLALLLRLGKNVNLSIIITDPNYNILPISLRNKFTITEGN